jgi:hypothetical protein
MQLLLTAQECRHRSRKLYSAAGARRQLSVVPWPSRPTDQSGMQPTFVQSCEEFLLDSTLTNLVPIIFTLCVIRSSLGKHIHKYIYEICV